VSAPGAWRPDTDGMRWRRRYAAGQTRMELLRRRHAVRRAVRDYMDGEGFIEIDAPLLVHGTTPDACIQSFQVGSHVVFYRLIDKHIDIVRILHQRMDFERHL